ncbi:MAG: hypothetical protein U5N21_02790 [Rhodococcus sp. (in: high G+C Gram-positive bacteria)]|nr:hypothetical protein [Rhodococcus sp. (in: high G+C Gram-positive bacteria)]
MTEKNVANIQHSEANTVTDVGELLAACELSDIVFYEVSALRMSETDSEPDKKPGFDMRIMTRIEPQRVEIRCRAQALGAGGQYVTDASSVFTMASPVEVDERVVREFAEKVGVMAVYPYIRESITQGGARLGLDRPILPLLRAGDVHLSADDD